MGKHSVVHGKISVNTQLFMWNYE